MSPLGLLTLISLAAEPAFDIQPDRVTVRHLSPDQIRDGELSVHVLPGGDGIPAVLGRSVRAGDELHFEPRFRFEPGVRYRIALTRPGAEPVMAELSIPAGPTEPTATVEAIFPSGDRIPANLLRVYVQFTEPMTQRGSYRHVRLLRADGGVVDLPFLELDEELWDGQARRLTLYIDPGRIKREVKPREDLGPVLEPGKAFTLVIAREWEDAKGRPLKAEFRKEFVAAEPLRDAHSPDDWVVTEPEAGTRDALKARFGRPMDNALARRMIRVVGPDGAPVEGEVSLAKAETEWSFVPSRPWPKGAYRFVIDTALEDVAGNRIDGPFEVDVFRRVEPELTRRFVERGFTIE